MARIGKLSYNKKHNNKKNRSQKGWENNMNWKIFVIRVNCCNNDKCCDLANTLKYKLTSKEIY